MDPTPKDAPTPAKDEQIALKAHGQRRISFLWETTQAVIAIVTSVGVVVSCGWMIITDSDRGAAFSLLGNLGILVLNMYFTRTNHTRVGGPGGDAAGTR